MHLTNMAVLLMTSCLLPWNDLAIHGIAFFPATAPATHLHLAAGQVVVLKSPWRTEPERYVKTLKNMTSTTHTDMNTIEYISIYTLLYVIFIITTIILILIMIFG